MPDSSGKVGRLRCYQMIWPIWSREIADWSWKIVDKSDFGNNFIRRFFYSSNINIFLEAITTYPTSTW